MEPKRKNKCQEGKLKNEEIPTKNKKIRKVKAEIHTQSANDSPSFAVLNDDILLMIFSFLTMKDLITIERVSKRWRALSLMSWKNIKKINMSHDIVSINFRLKHLGKVLKRSGAHLKQLELDWEYDYGDDCSPIRSIFLNINKYCKNLTHLNIYLADYPDRKNVNKISKSVAENLKSLHIAMHEGENCDKILGNLIYKACNLEEFSFNVSCSDGAPLHNLTEKCKVLSVERCYDIDNRTLAEVLKNLPNLEQLNLSGCSFFDLVLSSVSNQLVSLDVSSDVRYFFADNDSDNDYKNLLFDNLRVLNLSSSSFRVNDDVFLTFVNKSPLLEELNVSNCPEISSSSFYQLQKLKNLTILNVGSTNITGDVIKSLGLTLRNLKEVNCRYAKHSTDADFLKLIEQSPNLKKLMLGPSSRFTRTFFESAKTCVEKRLDLLPLTIRLEFRGETLFDRVDVQSEIKRLELKTFSSDNDRCTIRNYYSLRKKFNENPIIWCI